MPTDGQAAASLTSPAHSTPDSGPTRAPPRTPTKKPPRPLDYVATRYSGLAMVLIIPVSLTVFLVVWGVQTLTPIYAGRNQSPLFLATNENSPSATPTEKLGDSVINALVIVAMITVVTFLMVCLYKLRCMKVIIGWFIVSAGLIFFFLGWIWLDLCATRYQIPYDYLTMSIVIWNFGVVGMISVFYYSHPKMAQAYLVIMSVIMAWMLSRLPEWSTWAILIAVAIYDIVAVLCPKGPLQMLLKEAQEKNEPIPGFIYDSSAESAALPRGRVGRTEDPADRSGLAGKEGQETQQRESTSTKSSAQAGTATAAADGSGSRSEEDRAASPKAADTRPPTSANAEKKSNPLDNDKPKPSETKAARNADGADPALLQKLQTASPEYRKMLLVQCDVKDLGKDEALLSEHKKVKAEAAAAEEEEEEEEPDPWATAGHATPFKLGLGDFIFYSVLVARAAMFSYASWMICYISVLMGLVGTLSSLLFFRGKIPALPALPISIFLATIMFFASRYLVVPYLYYMSTTGFV